MKLYSYAGCSTCRRAIAWLRQHDLAVELIDITLTPPGRPLLEQAFAQLGRARLFNTSGQSYRALGAAAVKAMDDSQAIEALAADGRLIKRPLLVCDDGRLLIGFKAEEWQTLLEGEAAP